VRGKGHHRYRPEITISIEKVGMPGVIVIAYDRELSSWQLSIAPSSETLTTGSTLSSSQHVKTHCVRHYGDS
jgi:hypothetical protein